MLSNLKANKKIIFILVGIVILVELIWAVYTLTGKKSSSTAQTQAVSDEKVAALKLRADKSSVKVGESFTVNADITSAGTTDGADMILNYDPNLISVNNIQKPVNPGPVYSDNPLNAADERSGRINFSAITSNPGGVVPNGILGTLIFTAKAPGKAKISIEFMPGSTTDSNVVETKTATDILGSVSNLEIQITQ